MDRYLGHCDFQDWQVLIKMIMEQFKLVKSSKKVDSNFEQHK